MHRSAERNLPRRAPLRALVVAFLRPQPRPRRGFSRQLRQVPHSTPLLSFPRFSLRKPAQTPNFFPRFRLLSPASSLHHPQSKPHAARDGSSATPRVGPAAMPPPSRPATHRSNYRSTSRIPGPPPRGAPGETSHPFLKSRKRTPSGMRRRGLLASPASSLHRATAAPRAEVSRAANISRSHVSPLPVSSDQAAWAQTQARTPFPRARR